MSINRVQLPQLPALALGVLSFAISACSGHPDEGEQLAFEREGVMNGSSLNLSARPYEELMVDVRIGTSKCSGTLLGNYGSAQHVLTARHCVDGSVTPASIVVGRNSVNGQETLGNGVQSIFMHPDSSLPMPNTVDVALLELNAAVPVSSPVYFTNETPTELVGETARCYGAATFSAYRVGRADFTIIPTDSNGNPAIHFDLVSPNASGQEIVGGDSGGSCVRTTGTTSAVMYSITKTNTRQTAAVAFSTWVRTFVPR